MKKSLIGLTLLASMSAFSSQIENSNEEKNAIYHSTCEVAYLFSQKSPALLHFRLSQVEKDLLAERTVNRMLELGYTFPEEKAPNQLYVNAYVDATVENFKITSYRSPKINIGGHFVSHQETKYSKFFGGYQKAAEDLLNFIPECKIAE
ncbi:MAG: hypothetical protein HON90_12595 [Halobacteriovoraceae bacterium]|jgi:hypothetical protein|nr:hypothetical protein [Candidatus Falkowbacteria bacterium]MBT4792402.1 hypothetical protein [Halobacteriovoraceae bacterium]